MTKEVQPDGSVFGRRTTYLVSTIHSNLNFDHSLSKSKVMAEDWLGHFSNNSFYNITVREEVITFEAKKIYSKSELEDLVQT